MAATDSTTNARPAGLTPDACAGIACNLDAAAQALRSMHFLAGQALDTADANDERAELCVLAVQELARSTLRRVDDAIGALGGQRLGNFAEAD